MVTGGLQTVFGGSTADPCARRLAGNAVRFQRDGVPSAVATSTTFVTQKELNLRNGSRVKVGKGPGDEQSCLPAIVCY